MARHELLPGLPLRKSRSPQPGAVPHPPQRQADRDDDGQAEDALEPNVAEQMGRFWAKAVRDKGVAADPEDPATATPARKMRFRTWKMPDTKPGRIIENRVL